MRIKNIFTLLFILIFLAPFCIKAKVSKLRTNILTGITTAGCITTLIAAKKAYNAECKNKQLKPTIKGYGNFLKKVVLSFRYPRSRKLALKQHPKLMKLILGTQLFLGAVFVSKYMDNAKQKRLNKELCKHVVYHVHFATFPSNTTLEILIKEGSDVNAPLSITYPWVLPPSKIAPLNGDLPLTLACANNNTAAIQILVQNGAHVPTALKNDPTLLEVKTTALDESYKLKAQMLISCYGTLGNPQARCIKELPYDIKIHIAEWLFCKTDIKGLKYFFTPAEYRDSARYIPIPRLIHPDALAIMNQTDYTPPTHSDSEID